MMSTLQGNMLVIGSGGLLGSELMRFLSERYTVYGATRADLDITDGDCKLLWRTQIGIYRRAEQQQYQVTGIEVW